MCQCDTCVRCAQPMRKWTAKLATPISRPYAVSVRNRWDGALLSILDNGTLRHWPTLCEYDDTRLLFRPVVT